MRNVRFVSIVILALSMALTTCAHAESIFEKVQKDQQGGTTRATGNPASFQTRPVSNPTAANSIPANASPLHNNTLERPQFNRFAPTNNANRHSSVYGNRAPSQNGGMSLYEQENARAEALAQQQRAAAASFQYQQAKINPAAAHLQDDEKPAPKRFGGNFSSTFMPVPNSVAPVVQKVNGKWDLMANYPIPVGPDDSVTYAEPAPMQNAGSGGGAIPFSSIGPRNHQRHRRQR